MTHDEVDQMLERLDVLEVVTTWHTGPTGLGEAVITIEAMNYDRPGSVALREAVIDGAW
jgi:hypothetical protein